MIKNVLKTKIKSHSEEATYFYDKENSKVDSNHTSLVVINLDFALNKEGNYYPQLFLKACKYIKKKVIRHINDNFSYSTSSDSLMTLLKKIFSFDEHVKTLLLCKIMSSIKRSCYTTKYKLCMLCSVSFFLVYGPTSNTSRYFLYCLKEKNLRSRRKVSALGDNSQP